VAAALKHTALASSEEGINFVGTLIDVTITAATSTLTQAAAGPTTKGKETGAVAHKAMSAEL